MNYNLLENNKPIENRINSLKQMKNTMRKKSTSNKELEVTKGDEKEEARISRK